MSLLDWLIGSKGKNQSTLSPGQKQYEHDLYGGGGVESSPLYGSGSDFLMQLLSNDPEAFAKFEQPFKNQFEQETVPMLANRFAGMGTGAGAMNSSGFQQTLAQEGGNLSSQLAALRGGLQMQGLGQALNYAQQPHANKIAGLGIDTKAHKPGDEGILTKFIEWYTKLRGGGT